MRYFFLLCLLGCSNQNSALAEYQTPQKLVSHSYIVCGQKLILEEARTHQETSIGLMGRSGIQMPMGMIFIFPSEAPRSFWMKNVSFDIEIGYFNKNKKLISWMKMLGTSPIQNTSTLPKYSSGKPAKYAIETPVGFYSKLSKDQADTCVFQKVKN